MAVAHESVIESHTGTTGSASEASFDISVAFTASTRGLLVFTFVNANADDALSVKIDPAGANTDVPAVSGGRAVDTAGEPGDCKAWFLGSGLPTTTTTVRINRTNNANVMYAIALTVTAGGNTQVHTAGIVLLQNDGTVAEQSVDDGSPGTNSVRYAGANTGRLTPLGPGANSNDLGGPTASIDFGPRGCSAVRETTAGQGSRLVGFSEGTSDDRAIVHLAVKEVSASPTRGRVSQTEFEAPFQATRGRISQGEFEVPLAPTRGRVSQGEFELPFAATRGRASQTEFEVPSLASPTRGQVSQTEFEAPAAPTRGRISQGEFECPDYVPGGEYSGTSAWCAQVFRKLIGIGR